MKYKCYIKKIYREMGMLIFWQRQKKNRYAYSIFFTVNFPCILLANACWYMCSAAIRSAISYLSSGANLSWTTSLQHWNKKFIFVNAYYIQYIQISIDFFFMKQNQQLAVIYLCTCIKRYSNAPVSLRSKSYASLGTNAIRSMQRRLWAPGLAAIWT